MEPDSSDKQRAARAAFENYLRQRAGGEPVDFEEFCSRHPDSADTLRLLYAAYESTHTISEIFGARPVDDSKIHTRDPRGRDGAFPSYLAAAKRYTYRGELGRGGMGKILEVWDENINRRLAMKVENAPSQSGSGTPGATKRASRFLDEAQVTGQLDHPGVVPVHELGVDKEGRLFFTMQMVKGQDLQKIFERARDPGDEDWSPTRVLGVLVRMCEALAYAHESNVIHRDLKPANIMVGKHGEVYVMDWGLAKVLDQADRADDPSRDETLLPFQSRDSSEATLDGTVMGTLAYMPPEQAQGLVSELDARSDVYSVGAMLYELLAGRRPYGSARDPDELSDLLREVQTRPPKPLETIDRKIPPELVAICEKAMQRQPENRYASAKELGEEIQAYLETRVVKAHRTGPWIEFKKWLLRNKGMAASLAAAFAFLILGLVGVILVQWYLNRIIERNRYLVNINATSWQIETGDVHEARRLLEACPKAHRGWEWRHLNLKRDNSTAVWRGHSKVVFSARFGSLGGRELAVSGSEDGDAKIWDAETGELLRTLAGPAKVLSAVFSPDGEHVVTGSDDGGVRLFETSTGKLLRTFAGHETRVWTVAFSPDGRAVLSGSYDGSVRVWDTETGALSRIRRFESFAIFSVAFSADGQSIALGTRDRNQRNTLRLLTTLDDTPRPFEGHKEPILAVAFSSDGRQLLSGSGDTTVRLWDTASGEAEHVLRGHAGRVLAVAFSADGRRIVTGASDNTVRIWDRSNGALLEILRGHEGEVYSVAVSADGARILSGSRDETLRTWTVARSTYVTRLDARDARPLAVAFSPDGSLIACGVDRPGAPVAATVQVWDAGYGGLLFELAGHAARVGAVAFDPQGRRLASGALDGSVKVWDLTTKSLAHSLAGHEEEVTGIAFSRAHIATSSRDDTVKVWDAGSFQLLETFREPSFDALGVAFSPDGRFLVAGSGERPKSESESDGEEGEPSSSREKTVRVWSTETWELLRTLKAHEDAVRCVTFSPDGRRIASGSKDKTVRLWSAEDGELLQTLRGHKEMVLSVDFSPDGKRIVSGSRDNTIRVWDAETGDLLTVLRGHESRVPGVEFSPDGKRVASASPDRTIRVWESEERKAGGR